MGVPVIRLAAAASAALVMSACQTTATSSQPAEAMLIKSSPATTKMLSKAISKALGGRKITLAPNVLMDSPKLVMDPKFVDSRSMQKPDHFILMKEGKSCYLMHQESGQKMPLGRLKCQAL